MAIPKYRPCHTLGYCNYAEAVELADAIAKPELMFAGGVKSFRRAEENARIEPKDVDHTKNGIYIIRGMYAADPNPGADQQWCFRMLNGAAGMNCGIIIDWFRIRFPSSPGWVRRKLEQDANELAMYPDTTGE